MRRILILLIIMVLISLFSCPAYAKDSQLLQQSGQAKVGHPAPWLSGWTLGNEIFNIKKPFKDPEINKQVLVFFASWCAPCKKGIEMLNKHKKHLKNNGIQIVLINFNEPLEKVKEYMKKTPSYFPVVLDPFGQSGETYLETSKGTFPIPKTFIIDREGIVKGIIGHEGKDYVSRILNCK